MHKKGYIYIYIYIYISSFFGISFDFFCSPPSKPHSSRVVRDNPTPSLKPLTVPDDNDRVAIDVDGMMMRMRARMAEMGGME